MCRFFSGFFFDHELMSKYKWYWRVEPNVDFLCDLTYDPFVTMAQSRKRYGWAVVFKEFGITVPSLFEITSGHRESHGLESKGLWEYFLAPSWAPWLLRKFFISLFKNRDSNGDGWNYCHWWSNFEIADMDWFRSKEYRDYFRTLDKQGGFYFERVCSYLLTLLR